MSASSYGPLFPNLTFPELEDWQDTIPEHRSEKDDTAMELLVQHEPALADAIVRHWGSQRLHDDMHALLFGRASKLLLEAQPALLMIYNVHADNFSLESTFDAHEFRDTWWREKSAKGA